MMLRMLSNDGHVYHTMLVYIDAYLEEPEEFMKKVRAIAEGLHKGIIVQVINARNIAGVEHLLEVLAQSLEAERRSCLLARRVDVDTMLRLACTRQISDAMERVGLKRGSNEAALVVAVVHEEGYGEGKKEIDYHSILMRLKDGLKAVDGVKRVYDEKEEVKGEEYVYEHMYEHLAQIHGLSEQELASCISGNRLVSILAERANLLHR